MKVTMLIRRSLLLIFFFIFCQSAFAVKDYLKFLKSLDGKDINRTLTQGGVCRYSVAEMLKTDPGTLRVLSQIYKDTIVRDINGAVIDPSSYDQIIKNFLEKMEAAKTEADFNSLLDSALFEKFTRIYLTPLMKNPRSRKILVETSNIFLRQRSRLIKRLLIAETSNKTSINTITRLNYVVIGAGPNGLVFSKELKRDFRVMNIDASDVVGSNFSKKGDSFVLNSSNRPDSPDGINLPGNGNLNNLPGLPLQIPDFVPGFFPKAGDLGDALTINAAAFRGNSKEILLNTELIKAIDLRENILRSSIETRTNRGASDSDLVIRLKKDESGYRVENFFTQNYSRSSDIAANEVEFPININFRSGDDRELLNSIVLIMRDKESGKFFTVLTDKLVYATGLGPNKKTLKYPGELGAIDRSEAIAKKRPPTLQSFDEAMIGINQNERALMQYYTNKTITVVGYGDSARTFLERMLRITNNPNGYDSVQNGFVGQINWVIGSTELADCLEYITMNRYRYSNIAGGIKSGKIRLVSGRASEVVERGIGSTQDSAAGFIFRDGQMVPFNPEQVTSASDLSDKKINLDLVIENLGGGTSRVSTDLYVDATGYLQNSPIINTLNTDSAEVFAYSTTPSSNGIEVPVATRLSTSNQIYALGPSKNIIQNQDLLAGVAANQVSIFNNAPRAKSFAGVLNEGSNKNLNTSRIVSSEASRFTAAQVQELGRKIGDQNVIIELKSSYVGRLSDEPEKVLIGKVLSDLGARLGSEQRRNLTRSTFKITFKKNKNRNFVSINISDKTGSRQFDDIKGKFVLESYEYSRLLSRIFADESPFQKSVEFEFDFSRAFNEGLEYLSDFMEVKFE